LTAALREQPARPLLPAHARRAPRAGRRGVELRSADRGHHAGHASCV